jgi:predicted nuclease with TOPRIM domain
VDLHKLMADQEANHDRQQMELLAAIDDREARLGRLQETLNAQRDALQQLEHEKNDTAGKLQARADRLRDVVDRLADLEAQASQALEFARSEME